MKFLDNALPTMREYFTQRGLPPTVAGDEHEVVLAFSSGWCLRIRLVHERLTYAFVHPDTPRRILLMNWATVESFCAQYPTYLITSPTTSTEENNTVSHG